tara:strand:+ start:4734 stop:5123 length:390 start_codon:yes stop_codon:yes gene_type:complete
MTEQKLNNELNKCLQNQNNFEREVYVTQDNIVSTLLNEIRKEEYIEKNPYYYMIKLPNCISCKKAEKILQNSNLRTYTVTSDQKQIILEEVSKSIGKSWKTFPCIWRNGKWIGGYIDLEEYLKITKHNL